MYQELLDYIKKTKTAGLADEEIRAGLLKVGWPPAEIDQAFKKSTASEVKIKFPLSKNWLIVIYIVGGLALFAVSFGVLWYLDGRFDLVGKFLNLVERWGVPIK